MALPSALLRRRAELDQQDDGATPTPTLVINNDEPAVPAAIVPTPQGNLVPSLEPDLPLPTVSDFNFTEFEEQYAMPAPGITPVPAPAPTFVTPTVTSSYAADPRIEAMQRTIDQQTQMLQQLTETLQRQQAAPAAATVTAPTPMLAPVDIKFNSLSDDDVRGLLTPAELERFEASLPIISRISNRAAASVADQVREQMNNINARTEQAIQSLQRGTYDQALSAAVPDADALMSNPLFGEFGAQPVPYSAGVTVRDTLAAAHRRGDVRVVAQVFNEFRSFAKAKSGTLPAGVSQMQVPPVVAAAPTPTQQTPKRMLAWSKRDEAFRAFRAGRLSKVDLDKVKVMFDRADAEGRVDYSA